MSDSHGVDLINIAGAKTAKQRIPYTPYFVGNGKEIKNPRSPRLCATWWTGTTAPCCSAVNDSPALNVTRSFA